MDLKTIGKKLQLYKQLKIKVIGLLISLILVPGCLFSFDYPLLGAPAKNVNSLKIGVEVGIPPYSYIDDNGMLKGFNVDLIRAVSIELGMDIELYAQTWADLNRNLLNQELDALVSSRIDNTEYLASRAFVDSKDTIFVRTDNKYITDLEGFWNFPAAINNQSLSAKICSYLDKYNVEGTKIVMDQEHGFLLLMNNEVDAYIGNKDAGMYLIQKWNQEKYIKSVGEPFNIGKYAFFTNTSNKELLTRLDKGLEDVSKNGAYDKVYSKWFGENAPSYDKKIRQILFFVSIIAVIVLLLMGLAVKWNTSLKKEVERRTQALNQANIALQSQQNDLKDKDKFKEDILNSVPIGIITFNQQGCITSVNARAREVLNLSELDMRMLADIENQEISSKLNHFLDRGKLNDVLRQGNQYINLEGELTIGNINRILVYQIYPLRDSMGTACGAIVNFQDNSKERRLEEEMIKMDKMKSLDLLVSEFVHEIRTPLTSIKTMTELMPSKIDNIDFRQNMVEIVSMEVARLDRLVGSLAEYPKPKLGSLNVFDIKGTIENIILLLQRKIQEKAITVKIDLQSSLQVYGDKMQMMQVFINLILNSIEWVEDNGQIYIKGQETENNTVTIIFGDNGPGISEENIERVLEPFFTTRCRGTGLGLYICLRLLEQNKGSMRIISQEGQGTEVQVKLQKYSWESLAGTKLE